MAERVKLTVPDLGEFSNVEVIEILVSPGDIVAVEDGLVTLETDKAAMDVPASQAGKIVSVEVGLGDKVSTGDVVVTIEVEKAQLNEVAETFDPVQTHTMSAAEIAAATGTVPISDAMHSAQLVVIGAGPGGYTAAFRAADLGMDVILIERWETLGGVCLNVGCIPSKALLHAAKVIDDAAAMAEHGVTFGAPKVDALKLRSWKNEVVGKLTGGLAQLAKQRNVRVLQGTAKFESANRLVLDNGETIAFEKCIIAAGSESIMLPGLPDDPRIIDSTGALELDPLPKRMLVVGGGIIGLEMACVYSALGTEVSVVELMDSLMPGTDKDLLRPFLKVVKSRYEAIMTSTRVTGMRTTIPGIEVSFEGGDAPEIGVYDRVLVAVGRRANGDQLDADKAGVVVNERGVIDVDKQMRTNVPHIFAIGDLVPGPMLAHKATHEAKVAAEAAAGEKSYFDARTIPSVAYTDPEIAWVGLTETEAQEQGVDYDKTQIPWAASGRALALGRAEGFTKLLWDKQTNRVLGGAIVGPNAGDLIAEIGLAIEMGADAADIGMTVHPHPTLSETVAFAAEAYEGTLTDLYLPKKRV
ncbi:MAG: dihydrolipoyl dehydrogenase [Gammaproteobacteria bacterium]|nr:dihydrolipoyl dehydrogenase [Gammaproteobacteria bacterium]MDH3372461.1 dihydrolipoyl dehydrogenase [Gammaproteobacteria bacterium]MDH3407897.1 dihydrolipoyl dehydrogenase [Gammaproteobacteria bacterium]MDH3551847.1 dihydrolipoyl dehydrogenase [Gammaproteobacteria bacterium]